MIRMKRPKLIRITVLMLTLALLFGTLGALPVSAELGGRLIPEDAVEFEGHYYKVYDDLKDNKKATWEKANKFCKKRGGHLAVITSPDEDDFVSDYLSDMGYKNVFFGLKLEDGEWKWVNDEPFRYSNWGEKNPDGGEVEPYGQYYKLYSLRKWNDDAFGYESCAYVCEWDEGSKVTDAEVADAEAYIEKKKPKKLGNSYYRVFNNPLTQEDAALVCEKLGGHLAYITDAKEQAFINDLIAQDGKRNMYWIGAVQSGSSWNWMDGEKVHDYTNWTETGKSSEEDVCAAINFGLEDYETGAWVAKPPEGSKSPEAEYYINYGFVCEWELVCQSEEGEFIAHEESEWKTKLESDCEEGGERYRHCLRCGEITESERTPSEPHEYERKGLIGNLEIPGFANYVCKKCGAKMHKIEWTKIWIIPTCIIVYAVFVAAYLKARDDFEYKCRSQGSNILTKPVSKKLLVMIPIAAVLVAVAIAIL